jgi:hypothetical protein
MKSLLLLAALASLFVAAGASPKETALTKTARIVLHLNAPADSAFPLFDPVNETKWDPQWKPRLLGDRVEEGLVFLVGDGESRSTWLLDRYDPVHYRIAYVVAGPSTLTRIAIELRPTQSTSVATVTYTKTALDPDAVPSVEHFAAHFPAEAPHWESAINSVLAEPPR